MKGIATAIFGILLIALPSHPAPAAPRTIDFKNEVSGSEAKEFSSLVGYWHVDRDGARSVYAVDGRNREQGLMSANAKEKARALYGASYQGFLEHLAAYRYFPLSVCNSCNRFRNGTVEVSFKTVSGKIDQGAGIAFDIGPDGNYLVLRVNALEDNMVLFRMEGGRRTSLQWTRNVPTPANSWQTLKVAVHGKRIEGYLNGNRFLVYTWKDRIDGRVGLWSKADSYVFFTDFVVRNAPD